MGTSLRLHRVVPVLPCRDLALSLGFYERQLGFVREPIEFDADSRPVDLSSEDDQEAAGERPQAQPPPEDGPDRLARVRRDEATLRLRVFDPSEWRKIERPVVRIETTDVRALFEEYERQRVFHLETRLEPREAGRLEFSFFDPDQNELTFFGSAADR